jgi:hypothetical protein
VVLLLPLSLSMYDGELDHCDGAGGGSGGGVVAAQWQQQLQWWQRWRRWMAIGSKSGWQQEHRQSHDSMQ